MDDYHFGTPSVPKLEYKNHDRHSKKFGVRPFLAGVYDFSAIQALLEPMNTTRTRYAGDPPTQ